MNRTIDYFDRHFQRQIARAQFNLNLFEEAALPHLSGRVLELGCGMGNLAIALGQRGCEVVAIDASAAGIGALVTRARALRLQVTGWVQDALRYQPYERFAGIVCLGLLSFTNPLTAKAVLERFKAGVKSGGVMAFNVYTEGTTFLDMMEPPEHFLWRRSDIEAAFQGWDILHDADAAFPERDGLVTRSCTLVARKP